MPAKNKNLISTKEAGRTVGRSSDYVARLLRSEQIEGEKIGGTWLVDKESLLNFFDAKEDQLTQQKEELSSIRKQEYKDSQALLPKARKFVETEIAHGVFTAHNLIAMTASILLVFGGYLTVQANPVKQFVSEIKEDVISGIYVVRREATETLRSPEQVAVLYNARPVNYVDFDSVIPDVAASVVNATSAAGSGAGLLREKYSVENTAELTRRVSVEDITHGLFENYKSIGHAFLNAGMSFERAYMNGIYAFSGGLLDTGSLAYDFSNGVTDTYVSFLYGFAELAQAYPQAWVDGVYAFVETTPKVAHGIASVPYVVGDGIVENVAKLPKVQERFAYGVAENAPQVAKSITVSTVKFGEDFVATSETITQTYKNTLEDIGEVGGAGYVYARITAPELLEQKVRVAAHEAQGVIAGAFTSISQEIDRTVGAVVAEVLGAQEFVALVAEELVGGVKEVSNKSVAQVSLPQEAGVVSAVQNFFDGLFKKKNEPVLLVTQGALETKITEEEVVEVESAPVRTTPVTNNFYSFTDASVTQGYVDANLAALRSFILAEIDSLDVSVERSDGENYDNILDTLSEAVNGDLSPSSLSTTGSVTAGSFVGGTGSFGTTTISNLTVSGDTTFSGTLTVGGLTTTGPLSAPYFNATSTTATSTFAGGLNVGSGSFVYDRNSGNIGIGTTTPFTDFAVEGNSYFNGTLGLSGALTGSTASFSGLVVTNATTTNATTTSLAISGLTAGSVPFIGANGVVREDNDNFFFDAVNGRLGIGTSTPRSSLDIEGTDAVRIPVGTTAQRPSMSLAGQIRYNTSTAQYEGFDGSNWRGLGGVIDIDQDTYITAEESTDEDFLRFYTDGGERFTITNTGNVGVGTSSPYARFSVVGQTVSEYFTATSTSIASVFPLLSSTSATSTQLAVSSLTSGRVPFVTAGGRLVDSANFTFDGSVATITDVISTRATTTNATSTNLSISNTLNLSGLTASHGLFLDANNNVVDSAASSALANSLTDETGTGSVVFSASPTLTGTTIIADASITNATSTTLDVTGNLRLPNLTPSRLVALTANGTLTNSDLASWVSGTSNQVTVTDDGDGSITLSLPSTLSFTDFTAVNGTTTNATSTNLAIESLTSGRIPFVTTGGRIIDSASLTFDGSTVTAPRFVASSATATSTFAGGLAVETSGLVYDWQTNRVGIGTAGPTSKLHIEGSGQIADFDGTNDTGAVYARFGTSGSSGLGFVGVEGSSAGVINTDTLAYATYIGAAASGTSLQFGTPGGVRMTINPSGNVGIGTTNPSTFKLQVAGNVGPDADSTYDLGSDSVRWANIFTDAFVATRGTTTNATSTNLAVSGSISVPADSFGTNEIQDVYLLNTGDTATGDYNFDSNTLFIDSEDNRVGIGTNNPLKGLHVQQGGSSGLTSAFGDGLLFSTNSASGARIFLDNLGGAANEKAVALVNENVNGVGTFYFGALSDNGASWVHNHLLAFRLDNGYVGIGTSTPYAKLSVAGDVVGEYFTATSTSVVSTFPLLNTTSATSTNFYTTNFGINNEYISDLTGNGLSISGGKLNVATSSLASGFFQQGGNSFGATAVLGTNDSNNLQFETGGTVRVTIDTDGDVGIGSTTPVSPLSVAGSRTYRGLTTNALFSGAAQGFQFQAAGGSEAAAITGLNGDIRIYNDGSAASGNWAASDQTAIFTTSNTFGVGTSTPWAQVSVEGQGGRPGFVVSDSSNNTDFVVAEDGDVGIGSSAPLGRLYVTGSATQDVVIKGTGATDQTIQFGRTDSATNWIVGRDNTSSVFGIEYQATTGLGALTSAQAFTISQAGDVGIGSTTPAARLGVKGGGTGNNVAFAVSDSANSNLLLIQEDGDTVFGPGVASIGQAQYIFSGADNSNVVAFTDNSGNFRHVFGTDASAEPYWRSFNNKDLHFGINSTDTVHLVYNSGDDLFSVGSTTPYAKLTVQNTGTQPSFIVEDSSGDTSPFIIDASGNVGIGRSSATYKLDVSNTAGIVARFASSVTNSNPDVLIVDADNSSNRAALQIQGNGGSTEVAFFGSNGNVGIGTTSPANIPPSSGGWSGTDAKSLTIQGAGTVGDTGIFLRRADDAVGLDIWTNNGNGEMYIDSRWASSGGGINFRTQTAGTAVDVLTIKGNGNVGIGTTTPWGKLSVTNTGSGPSFVVEDATSPDSTPFIVDASGRVGVGTAAPGNKFSISIDSDDGISLVRSGWGTASGIFLDDDDQGQNGLSIVGPSSRDITFSLNGNDSTDGFTVYTDPSNGSSADTFAFGVFNDGNVGVGATGPDARLDIVGVTSGTGGVDQALQINGNWGFRETGNTLIFESNNSGTWSPTFTSNRATGNVGIGTSTPQTNLSISDRIQNPNGTLFTQLTLATGQNLSSGTAGGGNLIGFEMFGGGVSTGAIGGYMAATSNYGIGTWGGTNTGSPHLFVNNSGDVGIGTTTPASRLAVRGPGSDWGTLAVYAGTGASTIGAFSVFGDPAVAWTDALFTVRRGGNVGIGTSTPTVSKLQVAGDVDSNGFLTSGQLLISGTSNPLKRTVIGYDTTDNHGFIAAGIDGTGFTSFALQPSGGKVGIGTTSPDTTLEVAGEITALGADNTFLLKKDNVSTGLYANAGGNLSFWVNGGQILTFEAGSANLGNFTTNPAYRFETQGSNDQGYFGVTNSTSGDIFEIDGSGNVGIGDATPEAKLHVNYASSDLQLALQRGANALWGLGSNSSGTLGFYYDPFVTNTTPEVVINSSGNVGIGDTTPNYRLDVTSSGVPFSLNSSNSNTYKLAWRDNDTVVGYIGASSVSDLSFAVGSNLAATQFVVQNSTGRVGVNDTSPDYRAEIVGSSGNGYFAVTNSVDGDIFEIDSSGNVGVGTASPGAKLDISHSGNALQFQRSGYDTYKFQQSPGSGIDFYNVTDSRSELYFDGAGNVGFGGAPVRAVSIHNDTPFLEFRDTNQSSSHLITSVVEFVSSSATRTGFFGINSQAFQIQTDDRATDIPISFLTVGTERMRIGTDGRIGINDTSADYQLEVVGTSGNGFFGITNSSDGDIFEIDSNGNVGIGTNTPDAKLHIQTGTPASTDTNLEIGDPGDGSVRFLAINNARSAYKELRFFGVPVTFYGNGTENLRVHSNGFVGVGTTTPTHNLAVQSAADTNIFQLYDTDGNCLYNPESGSVTVSCSSDERLKSDIVDSQEGGLVYINDFRIRDYTVNASGETLTGVIAQELLTTRPEMVHMGNDGFYKVDQPNTWKLVQALQELDVRTVGIVSDNGNVGIGTDTPGYKLHVLGDVAATSFVNISTREAKKGITYLDEARKEDVLEQVKAIEIAEYRYEYESNSNPLRLGLIAEEAPVEILSVGGRGVDIYKLATFTLAAVQQLAVKVETLEERVALLEAQVAAGGSGSGSGFSTSTITAFFAELGILIEKGFAQFDKLAFRELVATEGVAGAAAAGSVTILEGNKVVEVENAQVLESSKIFVTFTSSLDGGWFIAEKQNGSFRVELDKEQDADVSFDYFILQTERSRMVEGDSESEGGAPTHPGGPEPVITIIGDNPMNVLYDSTFVDPGAYITDDVDPDISYDVYINGLRKEVNPFNTRDVGEHEVTYHAVDDDGNVVSATRIVNVLPEGEGAPEEEVVEETPAEEEVAEETPIEETVPEEEVVEEVADTTAPVITLNGKAAMKLEVGASFTDPGATATDDVDGDVTSSIAVSGTVDTSKVGVYTLTYSVADAAGNEASTARTVTVSAPATTSTEPAQTPEETVVE